MKKTRTTMSFHDLFIGTIIYFSTVSKNSMGFIQDKLDKAFEALCPVAKDIAASHGIEFDEMVYCHPVYGDSRKVREAIDICLLGGTLYWRSDRRNVLYCDVQEFYKWLPGPQEMWKEIYEAFVKIINGVEG